MFETSGRLVEFTHKRNLQRKGYQKEVNCWLFFTNFFFFKVGLFTVSLFYFGSNVCMVQTWGLEKVGKQKERQCTEWEK